MSEHEYAMVLRFDDQSPSFVHGFEAGQVWEKIQAKRAVIKLTAHTANENLIEKMAETSGYSIIITRHKGFDTWIDVEMTRRPKT